MSWKEGVINAVEQYLEQYISKVSEKYGIDQKELMGLAEMVTPQGASQGAPQGAPQGAAQKPLQKPAPSISTVSSEITPETIAKSSAVELKAMCKTKGLKCSGKKEELVARLLESLSGKPTEVKQTTLKAPPIKKATPAPATEIAKKITGAIPAIPIRRNAFGNFEHFATKLVLVGVNEKTSKVVGKQKDDGTVAPLTEEDIELCKQYKFNYEIPENLDTNKGLKNVKIEGLDEEEEIVVKEDSEEDEEEGDEEEEDEEIIIED